MNSQEVERTLRHRIEGMAERYEDAVFLLSPETTRRTTYRQLARRADNYARKLLKQGLTPGDKVASLLNNGVFTAEWLLGTMYGGFVPVPLNPCLSGGDLAHQLANSEAKLLLVESEYRDFIHPFIPANMSLEIVGVDDALAPDDEPAVPLPEGVREGDEALIAYTSGSTGRPKGVVVSHRNLIEGGLNTVNAHRLTEQDRSLCVLPLYHMNAQVITLIATLLSGGSIVVPHQFKVARFWNWVGDYRCTWFALVPSLISQLIQSHPNTAPPTPCAWVRFARSSSAPLPPSLMQAFEETFRLPLIEAMGMTEAGGAIFSNPLPPGTRKAGSPGQPWGFECRIVDTGGSDLPMGGTGEILVRGPSVMKGYFKDAKATAEILDSDGWLRTGDLGYQDNHGFIFLRGRNKDVINRGGEKITMREIDETLTRHPAVQEAVALSVPDRALGEDLVAWVVLGADVHCTEEELLDFCRSELGILKTPSSVYLVDDLPRGPTGKIQRQKLVDRLSTGLPEPFPVNAGTKKGCPLSQEEIEISLINLWSTFLKCDRVQREDNFFELGGSSLLAIQMVSRLRTIFNVGLSVSFFFEYPTIIRQAARITDLSKASPSVRKDGPNSLNQNAIFPLSASQQRLLFIQRLNPDSSAYNEAETFRLEGPLDIHALDQTIQALIARHEMLRTTIEYASGGPVQLVHQHLPLQLLQIDLSPRSQHEREEALRVALTTQMKQPFDLARQLFRAAIFKLSANEHVLLLILHHLVCDGWSMGILHQELSQCYLGFKTGKPPALEPLPCQYATFVEREQTRLSDAEAVGRDVAFWRNQLCNPPELLTLPTDRPRPSTFSHRGARVPVHIDQDLSLRLRQMAQRRKVSLFTVVAAAFHTFLFRYSGQSDIMIGIPIAHRDHPEYASLIGMLVETAILRNDLPGESPFSEVLMKMSDSIAEVLRHRTVPFKQLSACQDLAGSFDRVSLFQVLLNWGHPEAHTDLLGLDGLRIRPMEIDRQTAKFELTLSLTDRENEICGFMEFSTDLWDRSTICRMLHHYITLLKALVAHPERPLHEFSLLTENERHQLLVEWNVTTEDYPRSRCIHELFEEQAERTPDAIAIVCQNEQLTYRALNERAKRLGLYLRGQGVGPEMRIGLYMEPSVDLVVTLLGILKTGSAYVPLDPLASPERLAFFLHDAGIELLLTHSSLRDRFPSYKGMICCLDTEELGLEQEAGTYPIAVTIADSLAYIMYTSGSTGQPKGVCVGHRAVIRLVKGTTYTTFSSKDVYVHMAPLAFDASTFEIWGALLNGGRLVVLTARPPTLDEIGEAILQNQVTTLWLTAGLFHVMVSERIEALKPLEYLLAGGDVLSPFDMEKARRELNRCRLVNGYGPTEGTTFSCCYEIPSEEALGHTLSIGRPIANTTIYILDVHKDPVPIGVQGELYIGGEGLARGYWNQPDLTAERFIPNPYGNQPGTRLYMTGDGARYRPDGNIEFLGRRDHQVKIRGYRVELGEIEATLEQQDSVRQATVLAREDRPGDKRLVAYVVPTHDHIPDAGELREQLALTLPDYMVPGLYVFIDAFPLTLNGKVDYRALPAPEGDHSGPEKTTVTPRTQTERELAEIWNQLLGVKHISVQDHFFRLGGHSLMAIRLATQVQRLFGVRLSLEQIFQTPTLGELAKRIEILPVGTDPWQPSLPDQGQEAMAPVAYEQERMWILQQTHPQSPVYTQSFALRIQGNLHVEALRKSLCALEERHDPLRTTFSWLAGHLEQWVHPAREWSLTPEDLRSLLPPSEREDRWQALAGEEVSRVFDLSSGPVWRVRLFQLKDTEHVLLLIFHHICLDEWSIRIFGEELSQLYQGLALGHSISLAPLPCRYIDYVQWQWQELESGIADIQLAYWRKKLGEEVPVLNLPTDYPRRSAPDGRGATEKRLLSGPLLERLKRLSGDKEITLFMTLLGAFQILLSRYSGQDDILVGTPIATRDLSKFQNLIGLFQNTLVMRGDLAGQPTVSEMLTRVRKMSLEAYAHRKVPFQKVVQALRSRQEKGNAPLFQVMFVLNNLGEQAIPLGPLKTILSPISTGTAKFDLTLFLEEKPTGLQAIMEYRTDLFQAETIQRMLGHFEILLEGMVNDPEMRITELPLQRHSERHQALVEWNQTAADYPRGLCIHQLVEGQVTRTPAAVALVFGNHHLTYGELNRRANQVAHYLQKMGVGPETVVGLYVGRSLEMVIGLLGILKAGGIYVPLDPGYPTERLRFMLKDVKPIVVLTTYEFTNHLDGLPFHKVLLNEIMISAEKEHTPFCRSTSHNLAYLLFTSGSTGYPKAVAIQHQTLVNLVAWQNARLDSGAGACTLQFSSLNFDVSLQEIFSSLCGGGILLLISEEIKRDLPALACLIEEQQVTRIFVPFAVLESLTQALLALEPSPRWLLEFVTAGEQLHITPSMVQLFTQLDKSVLANQYGPTEAHVVSEYSLIGPPSEWMLLPPIGRPIANTQLYILDDKLNPVPIGVRGELYIGGENLGRAYWNRAGLTAEKFLPHPFVHHAGTRIYKTGDWARYRIDGQIEFLGRRDHQVKIRGYRIELGEIETTLEQQTSVGQAIVLAREDPPGDKRLVAYVVPTHSHSLHSGELQEELALTLPDYMIPKLYVFLDAFPLTSNGKVDLKSLPVPDQKSHTPGIDFNPPRTSLEKKLIEMWGDLLKVPQIGIHDNFFDLGGNSLLATQVVGRTQAFFQKKISIRTLFDHPTVSQFAATLDKPMTKISTPPLFHQKYEEPPPLSFAQQRLWFLEQWEPGNTAYLLPYAWRLRGALDCLALEASMTALVARHESLRTACSVLDGQPIQVIRLPAPVALPLLDLTDRPEAMREEEVKRLIQEDIHQPFDLTVSPLWRAQLIRVGPEDHVFLLTFHHLITDGWSMGILFKELNALYVAQVTGDSKTLPALPVQYADYAMWQRNWLNGEALDRQVTFWQTQLAEAPPNLELPTDYPRPSQLSYRGNSVSFTLSSSLTEALNSLSRQEGVTLFMTTLAAFQILLFRYTGQRDILVGSPIAGRTHVNLEHLIGYLANTLVLRARFIGQPTFQDVLQQVKETCLNAFAYQDLPFEKLVETLQPVRDSSRHPIFQVMFQLQHESLTNELDLLNLDISPLPKFTQTAKFDLSLGLVFRDKTLNGTVIFNTELFELNFINRLGLHYQALLQSLANHPTCPVSQLSLMPETERQQILFGWNPPLPSLSPARTVHELFEIQAARSPDAVALVCREEQLTYEALNKRVNQMAHVLIRHGVGPEVRVAICLERSIHLFIALLGILKAGGAYVPLDPSTPVDRMAFILTEAQVGLVLTQSSLLKQFQSQNPASDGDPLWQPNWIAMDDSTFEIRSCRSSNPRPIVSAENLAYVIYTSGSTGKPKGVAITQANLTEFAQCASKYLAIEPHDRILQFASSAFDACVEEIFPCLLRGGTLVLRPEDMIETVSTFWDTVKKLQVTVLDLPTAYWHELTNALSVQSDSPANCVRLVVIGGEQARTDQLAIWHQHMPPHLKLLNTYGPTEATVVTAREDLSLTAIPEGHRLTSPISIGRPLENRSIYILDSHLQPTPIGVPGELYLGGQGLGRGYDYVPSLTAAFFLPDPFSPHHGARLYRTGDRGRFRANGTIELLGRVDQQIKIRGYRVELEEIESCLRQIPEIQDAVVVPQFQDQGHTSLVAYVVSHQHLPLSATSIRQVLQGKLPHFMVPGRIIQLEELPRLPSGKINRRVLSSQSATSSEKDTVGRGPETAVEESLVNMWRELLNLPSVTLRDNFFELGGHSLLATRLVAKLRETWQSDFPLRMLFDHPILEDQALVIEEHLLQEIEELSEEGLQSLLKDQEPQ